MVMVDVINAPTIILYKREEITLRVAKKIVRNKYQCNAGHLPCIAIRKR